jgi:hypothetical protein
MTKPGPSPEYRDLLNGRISAEEYVKKLKRSVNERLGAKSERMGVNPASSRNERPAAAS